MLGLGFGFGLKASIFSSALKFKALKHYGGLSLAVPDLDLGFGFEFVRCGLVNMPEGN